MKNKNTIIANIQPWLSFSEEEDHTAAESGTFNYATRNQSTSDKIFNLQTELRNFLLEAAHNPKSIEYEEYMAAYLIKIGYLMGYNVILTDQNEDGVLETLKKMNHLCLETLGRPVFSKSVELLAPSNLVVTSIAQLVDGYWKGKIDISGCVQSGESPPPKILIKAQIFEQGTFSPVEAVKEWDTFASGFEMIPLRPAYTPSTTNIRIYFRVLSTHKSLLNRANSASSVQITLHCISNNKDSNGLNESIVGHHLGAIFEWKLINKNCNVHIIKAYRKLGNDVFTREEMLVLPKLTKDFLDFGLISTANIPLTKVEYNEGEIIEVHVPPDRQINYLLDCESREIVEVGSVSPGHGRIMIPVSAKMQGACILYVFENHGASFKTDMHLFFISTMAYCPRDYALKLSSKNISVFDKINVLMEAPKNSLALLHAYDSRLEGLLRIRIAESSRKKLWQFNEFLSPDANFDLVYVKNLLHYSELLQNLRSVCKQAAKQTPQCLTRNGPINTPSHISDICLEEIVFECEELKNKKNAAQANLNDKNENEPIVHRSGVFSIRAPSKDILPRNMQPQNIMRLAIKPTEHKKEQENKEDEDNIKLREFFPEVWLFQDYKIGKNGILNVTLEAPHSVTEWRFSAGFWTPGRPQVCRSSPSRSLFTTKHVFMNVEVPTHVYENETVIIRVTVTADNLENLQNMAVCLTGLSPIVCGDVGRDGNLGETDYTRVSLSPEEPIKIKLSYIRFLREGLQNMSFELRAENTLPGGEWHCRDSTTKIYDRIFKQIHVSKRVDLETHYRQIIVYKQRRLFDYDSNVDSSVSRPRMLFSTPDVISYSQENDYEKLATKIHINSMEHIYNIDMELSKFSPSFPPSIYADLLPYGNSLMRTNQANYHRSRERNRRSLRMQANTEALPSTNQYSLTNVLKELAFLTYELKTIRQQSAYTLTIDQTQKMENKIANLLSELLTFSDCQEINSPCGFGEFGRPHNSKSRNLLLTTIATSLLCEQNASEDYVCGPILYLAQIVNEIKRSNFDMGFDSHLNFQNKMDEILFMESLMVRTGADCSIYTCTSSIDKFDAWDNLTRSIYIDYNQSKTYDLRTITAIAYTSTPSTQPLARMRIENMAKNDRMPFWQVENTKNSKNLLDSSLSKSGNILANSLALLAYTARNDVYQYSRGDFDFEALVNWLIEQQNELHQFENAIDNYFGCRALYNYYRLQWPNLNDALIDGNISSTEFHVKRSFNAKDLPFILNLPSITKNLLLETKGEGRLLIGIQLITERRRRSKRDPSELYPVTIRMEQRRDPQTQLIIQTVTIVTHSAMLSNLIIEHGLFTGFSSSADLIKLQNGNAEFLHGPKLSATAIYFVLKNLIKDEPITYTVTVIEPQTNYSPQNLAPIAISASRDVVMGRLIVSPSMLSFSSQPFTLMRNNMAQHPRVEHHHLSHRRRRRRNHRLKRSESRFKIPYIPAPFPEKNFPKIGSVSLIENSESKEIEIKADIPETQKLPEFMALRGDTVETAGQTHLNVRHSGENDETPSSKRRVQNSEGAAAITGSEMLQASLQTAPPDLVETVCLANGACTCAEVTCSLRCINCSQLSYNSICEELNRPNRFSLIFRILKTSLVNINGAEYNVFDVNILDWHSEKTQNPDQLSIWLRKCNEVCIRMTAMTANAKNPRYLLIGNSIGLFDGTNNNNNNEVETIGEENIIGRSSRESFKSRLVTRSVMRTHYVMRDGDRLAKSTDCWPLFGRLQDEQC